jgi:hypothetical protein
MPKRYRYSIFCCVSLPPAALSSVPIYDFSIANEGLANEDMETIIHVFVEDARTRLKAPVSRLETGRSVHFAIPTKVAKQTKKWLKN